MLPRRGQRGQLGDQLGRAMAGELGPDVIRTGQYQHPPWLVARGRCAPFVLSLSVNTAHDAPAQIRAWFQVIIATAFSGSSWILDGGC
jgi:hypothetical protein